MSRDDVTRLIEALSDTDGDQRFDAAVKLGAIGDAAGDAIPALIRVLAQDEDSGIQEVAATALADIGSAAEEALREALGDKDVSVRATAAEGLAYWDRLSESTVELLRAALDDPSSDVRSRACTALARAARAEDRLIDAVARLLDDKTPSVREAAVDALAAYGGASFSQLVGAAGNEDERVRERAIAALGDVGVEEDKSVLPVVLSGLDDAAARVRVSAAEALRYFGADSEEAVSLATSP